DAAAALPGEVAGLLQHHSGLWTHSWWTPAWHSRRGRRFPRATFWARGNGWVVAALPMILGQVGDHERAPGIVGLLEHTSGALLPLQTSDGSWTTVLGGARPGRPETTATALIAAGWLESVRRG